MSTLSKRLLWSTIALAAFAAVLVPRLDLSSEAAEGVTVAVEETLRVETHIVTPRRLVESFSTVGTIQADEQVEIRSEIAGVLNEIHFDEGARVRSGQLLVKIDDTQLTAERDRTLHRVELARLRESRFEGLAGQGLISQDEYDLALSQLRVLDAELRLAEARLEKTRITAPFGGVIGFRAVSPGSAITPQTRIATLQKLDRVKLEFSVPERYAAWVRPGGSAAFRVRGSERDFEARIYAVEPSVDRETRPLRARARCANPSGELLPGAFADVSLTVREIEDALMVPSMAVIPELGAKKVFVLEQGLAVSRRVETGIRTESEVEITHGLSPNDRVIVSGIQRLSSGLPVEERPAP